ncbi:unnamed protein product [Rotaria sp. Silwood1]|nr:unnamed protein product [Rotaria sp. Silwood1]CAF4591888.1 unnamed protein product [Rotaria sp. Silwood1]
MHTHLYSLANQIFLFLFKGLIRWKWDKYAAKHFYLRLAFEVLFLILWTCTSLIGAFPIRYMYRFPQDIWRLVLWSGSIGFLIWAIVLELYDIRYARKRYEDYVIWETERTQNRLDLISKNKYKPNTAIQSSNNNLGKFENDIGDTGHITINETATTAQTTDVSSNPTVSGVRSHHSQHHPLPTTIPTIIKGKPSEPLPNQQQPLDAPINPIDPSNSLFNDSKKKSGPNNTTEKTQPVTSSRFVQFLQRYKTSAKRRIKSYYMYYSLNNLFDWIIYVLCLITIITHAVDVLDHTVIRARIHMYVASVTVVCIWFRFMVFFRTISISFKTLRAKIVEIKLGELVIMVRMMFDDIIRFLLVFACLLLPYALVFYAVFGGRQIFHTDYLQSPELCEKALLYCPIIEESISDNNSFDPYEGQNRYIFNGTSAVAEVSCYNATNSCHLVTPYGFETFYSLLFSIFRIALVDDIPIVAFNLIDSYFAAFVCTTYLLFTAILAVNIFIGLISNALQTEAFSTVEARFLLERIQIILNYEWRLSSRKRLQLQEMIHRQCSPLQLNWKDINFNSFGQSREEQQAKAFAHFRQTIDKHNIQFNTFRIQVQQKLNDIDTTLTKLQSTTVIPRQNLPKTTSTLQENTRQNSTTNTQSPSKKSSIHQSTEQIDTVQPSSAMTTTDPTINIAEELGRLRELLEETLAGQHGRISTAARTLPGSMGSMITTSRPSAASVSSFHHQQTNIPPPSPSGTNNETRVEPFSQNLHERVTDLQLAVNRLHQDVTAIRQVIERMSPLTTSLILGRTTTRR